MRLTLGIAAVTAFEKLKMNKVIMFNKITAVENLYVSRYFGNALVSGSLIQSIWEHK